MARGLGRVEVALDRFQCIDLERLELLRLNDATHLNPLFGEVVHRRL